MEAAKAYELSVPTAKTPFWTNEIDNRGEKGRRRNGEERGESWPRVRTFYFSDQWSVSSDQWLFPVATSHRSLATGHRLLVTALFRQRSSGNIGTKILPCKLDGLRHLISTITGRLEGRPPKPSPPTPDRRPSQRRGPATPCRRETRQHNPDAMKEAR